MVFFDYDGVIVDSLWLWEQSCQEAAKLMNFKGGFPQKPYARLNPLNHKEIGKILGLEPLEFEQIADKHFLKHIHLIKMFNGTKELITELSRNYNLSIMSASSEEIVQQSLDFFEILPYFSNLYCGSSISKAEKLMQYKEAKSIMVGDSISDMEAAKTANVYGIGVLWGWQDALMLKNADILVENHEQLKKAIKDFYENHSAH